MCDKEIIDNNIYLDIDESVLIDRSYTVSYYFETQTFLSFHDWIPDILFSLRDNQLISFKDNTLYYHNKLDSYCKFYDEKIYESYLTPVFSTLIKENEDSRRYPVILQNINWNCDINDIERRRLDKTFNYISVHDSYQSSIRNKIILYDDKCTHIENYRNYNCRRVKNHWEFNRFKDDIINKNKRSLNELITDIKEVNVATSLCKQDFVSKKRFIDDWFIIKLVYDNKEQLEMLFYDLNFTFKPVRR